VIRARHRLARLAERPVDPQAAFRAGVMGWRYQTLLESGPTPFASMRFAFGPNEGEAVELERLPGLVEPRAAFECGRALRGIVKLLDRAGAPASVGRQFIGNVAAAAIAHHARRTASPWGAAETIAMFMELYARILRPGEDELARVESALRAYAGDDLATLPGGASGRQAASEG
jgi:hypothetical protein